MLCVRRGPGEVGGQKTICRSESLTLRVRGFHGQCNERIAAKETAMGSKGRQKRHVLIRAAKQAVSRALRHIFGNVASTRFPTPCSAPGVSESLEHRCYLSVSLVRDL